jgi:hypothetical protein
MLNRGFSCRGSYQNHKARTIKKLCSAISPQEQVQLRSLILARANFLGEQVDEQSLRLALKHLGGKKA